MVRQNDPRRYASSQAQQEGSDKEPDVGADHENVAVGKVDQQQHAVDHRVAQGN